MRSLPPFAKGWNPHRFPPYRRQPWHRWQSRPPVRLGCIELHGRIMVGVRTERLELDEAWSFVTKKATSVLRQDHRQGRSVHFYRDGRDAKAINSWGIGKRNMEEPWISYTHPRPPDRPARDANGRLSSLTAQRSARSSVKAPPVERSKRPTRQSISKGSGVPAGRLAALPP